MIDFNRDYDPDEIDKEINEKIEEQEEIIRQRYPNQQNNNNNNNNNSTSTEIIHLKIPDQENGLIKDAIYNIDTNNIRVSLNHSANSDIVFTIDKKRWQNNIKFLLEDAKDYGITDTKDRNVLKALLNDNEKLLQAEYYSNSSKLEVASKEQQHGQQGGAAAAEQKIKVAELLLEIFNEQDPKPILFKDQFKVPHALVNIDDHYKILPIEDPKFRQYLTILYYNNLNEIPNTEAIRNVAQYLTAKSIYNKNNTITLHLRTAWSNNETRDSIYYDMSDDRNRSMKITKDGWTILENQTDVLFRQYDHQIPQVEPLSFDDQDDQDDVLEQFITLLNIKNKNDRLLLKCYIVSLFLPDIPHVVLILLGEQGGAKSTLQELVRSLVDPSILKNLAFPSNENDFVQQLSHSYIVYYDNVSFIQEWISNLLCRAVTGSSLSKRALYTNDQDVYYSFMRKLGINGIDLAKINDDLSDRSITIKPERIGKFDREKINKIWNQFNALKPRLLGYIFNILSKVLKYKETHGEIQHPNGLNRMADWEEYAEIISRCMGNPDGKLQQVYQENINKQVDDAVASSQLCMAVIELVESEENNNNEWEERIPTELYEKLSDIAIYKLKFNNISNRKYWPQSPGSLTYNLNKVKTTLREKGIEVITGDKNKDGKRAIKLIKLNSPFSNTSERSSRSSTSSNEGKSSTKQEENLDDLIKDKSETSSTTSSTENSQNQAQNKDFGRLDDVDDLYPTKEEKYRQEQEEQKNWGSGLD